jgi:cysteine dioxygenase
MAISKLGSAMTKAKAQPSKKRTGAAVKSVVKATAGAAAGAAVGVGMRERARSRSGAVDHGVAVDSPNDSQHRPAAHHRPPCAPQEAFPKLASLIGYLQGLKGRADLKTLSRLLRELKVTREDLQPACQFGVKGYRRNVIAASEHFELLALTWRSGHCTPIHDHRGVSCAFRVVEGTGTEVRFVHTPCGLACPTGSALMEPGYVCAADEPDIHQVANHQAAGEDLITLHIYSPRITKMNVYRFYASEGAEDCDAYKKAGKVTRPSEVDC